MKKLVEADRFREDLYYRLGVIILEVPPLRERGEDIILLAEHFLSRFSKENSTIPPTLFEEIKANLIRHFWPGNIRELRNLMERVSILAPTEDLQKQLLLDYFPALREVSRSLPEMPKNRSDLVDLDGMKLIDLESAAIARALERNRGNMAATAKSLGVGYAALRHRLAKRGFGD